MRINTETEEKKENENDSAETEEIPYQHALLNGIANSVDPEGAV